MKNETYLLAIKYEIMNQLSEFGLTMDEIGYIFKVTKQSVSKSIKLSQETRDGLRKIPKTEKPPELNPLDYKIPTLE